eukprot:scaffold9.g3112.t1
MTCLHEWDVRQATREDVPALQRTYEPPEPEADPQALKAALQKKRQLLVLEGQLDGWVPSGRTLARLGPFRRAAREDGTAEEEEEDEEEEEEVEEEPEGQEQPEGRVPEECAGANGPTPMEAEGEACMEEEQQPPPITLRSAARLHEAQRAERRKARAAERATRAAERARARAEAEKRYAEQQARWESAAAAAGVGEQIRQLEERAKEVEARKHELFVQLRQVLALEQADKARQQRAAAAEEGEVFASPPKLPLAKPTPGAGGSGGKGAARGPPPRVQTRPGEGGGGGFGAGPPPRQQLQQGRDGPGGAPYPPGPEGGLGPFGGYRGAGGGSRDAWGAGAASRDSWGASGDYGGSREAWGPAAAGGGSRDAWAGGGPEDGRSWEAWSDRGPALASPRAQQQAHQQPRGGLSGYDALTPRDGAWGALPADDRQAGGGARSFAWAQRDQRTCFRCGAAGHIARDCPTHQQPGPHAGAPQPGQPGQGQHAGWARVPFEERERLRQQQMGGGGRDGPPPRR